MNPPIMSSKISRTLIFVLALFVSASTNAWHGGGGWHGGGYHGGGYHGGGWHGGGWHGGYGGWRGGWGGGYGGWGGPGVVVGIPMGGYYGPQCSIVQRCNRNGGCYRTRICN